MINNPPQFYWTLFGSLIWGLIGWLLASMGTIDTEAFIYWISFLLIPFLSYTVINYFLSNQRHKEVDIYFCFSFGIIESGILIILCLLIVFPLAVRLFDIDEGTSSGFFKSIVLSAWLPGLFFIIAWRYFFIQKLSNYINAYSRRSRDRAKPSD